jgi:peptidoglycan hydrolase-like protein with peptidoglycan-binding domain
MSRSVWAAAGASLLAFALSPGAAQAAGGGSSAAPSATARAKQVTNHLAVPLAMGSGYREAGGSRQVRALQRRLAASGFAPGPIDGRYGPLTTRAVERFQAADGVAVDGIVGIRTLSALKAMAHARVFPGAGYRQAGGSRTVRVLQRRLAAAGLAPGPLDGRYGPRTARAVKRFQRDHRLAVDGIAGARTLAGLVAPGRVRAPTNTHRSHRIPLGHPSEPVGPLRLGPPLPLVRPIPQGRPAGPASGPGEAALPVASILMVLAMLGLATTAISYVRTRAGVRRAQAIQPRRARAPLTRLRIPQHARSDHGRAER